MWKFCVWKYFRVLNPTLEQTFDQILFHKPNRLDNRLDNQPNRSNGRQHITHDEQHLKTLKTLTNGGSLIERRDHLLTLMIIGDNQTVR